MSGVVEVQEGDYHHQDLWIGVNHERLKIDSIGDVLIAGKLGINNTTPDSLVDAIGGGSFSTDILVGGGWDDWTPTITWSGGTLTTPPTTVARRVVTNNTVTIVVTILGTNDSGNTLTDLKITLPYTPADINAYIDAGCLHSVTSKAAIDAILVSHIDALDNTPANRMIYTAGFTLANSADYMFTFTADYEITGK